VNPGNYDLELYRGDYHAWRFRLWDDKEKTQPTNLTDAVAEAEIRDRYHGSSIVYLECEIVLPNFVDMRMWPEMWAGFPSAGGVWDLEITFPGNVVQTKMAGEVTVTQDVTNSGAPCNPPTSTHTRSIRPGMTLRSGR
jgi:hypothetical protein